MTWGSGDARLPVRAADGVSTRVMDTMPNTDAATRRPTPELLVEVRTPAEVAASPDGTRLAFSLHATVSERGPIAPSDLYLLEPGDEPVQLTEGEWSDRAPTWSPDGSRLAFVSDRIKRGHFLPYVMPAGGGEPRRWEPSRAAPSRSRGRPTGGGCSWARPTPARTRTRPRPWRSWAPATTPTRSCTGGAEAYRRLFLIDVDDRRRRRGRPAGPVRVGVGLGRRRDRRRDRLGGSDGERLVRRAVVRLDLEARTATTLHQPDWPLEGLALSPDGRRAAIVEGYSSDPGLLSGSVIVVDMQAAAPTDPWPGLETVGAVEWIGDDSLVYARYDGVGTACGRLSLDGRRRARGRGDAFIGDEIGKPVARDVGGARAHHAPGARPAAGARPVRSGDRRVDPAHRIQRRASPTAWCSPTSGRSAGPRPTASRSRGS